MTNTIMLELLILILSTLVNTNQIHEFYTQTHLDKKDKRLLRLSLPTSFSSLIV